MSKFMDVVGDSLKGMYASLYPSFRGVGETTYS